MHLRYRKSFLGVLLFQLVLAATATLNVRAQFNYTINNGAVTITAYTGSGGAVQIPATIENVPVRIIGQNAFAHRDTVTSVTIPNTVTNIDDAAFWPCLNLANVTIGAGVVRIGNNAFRATSLQQVMIPASVTAIGDFAFDDCGFLTAFAVDSQNPVFADANGLLMNKDKKTVILCPSGITGDLTVPAGVSALANESFYGSRVRSVVLPQGLLKIGDFAFGACVFTNIDIPSTVTNLGIGSFASSSITKIIIPDSVTNISDRAFSDCRLLTQVNIGTGALSLGDQAFFFCNSLTNIVLPNGIMRIGDLAFEGCINLATVQLPENLVSIGEYAFQGCALKQITIPNRVVSIPTQAFAGCTSLGEVHFPAGLASIGDEAFGNCMNLALADIPQTVTNIGRYAFVSCGKLTDARISGAVYLGDWAFAFCSALTNVTFSPNLAAIQDHTFASCASLTTLILPSSVTNIADNAFRDCVSLEKIILSRALTTIGVGSFWNTSLRSITIPANVASIGTFAFAGNTNLTAVYFEGNSPATPDNIFLSDVLPTVYYGAGAVGWGATFAGAPAVLFNPTAKSLGFSQNHFQFVINGPTNSTVVVEANGDLNSATWSSVSTNVLDNAGLSSFTDGQTSSQRFYRFRSP